MVRSPVSPRGVKGSRSPSPGARAAAGVLGEGQAELRAARCLFGPGGLEQEEFLKKKKKIETLRD